MIFFVYSYLMMIYEYSESNEISPTAFLVVYYNIFYFKQFS